MDLKSSTIFLVLKHNCLLAGLASGPFCSLCCPRSSVAPPSVFIITEQTQFPTLRSRIKTILTSVQTDQIINSTHSADYSSTIIKSVMVQFSNLYDNRLVVTEMIHCLALKKMKLQKVAVCESSSYSLRWQRLESHGLRRYKSLRLKASMMRIEPC